MSVDLSDEDIYPAYDSVLRRQNDWLLLQYSTRDKLFLSGFGAGGIEELRTKLEDDVYFGFCRLQHPSLEESGVYVLLSYVPEGVSGVKRARSLVHGRAVGTLFKAHQFALTLRGIGEVTLSNILSKLDKGAPLSPSSQVSTFSDNSTQSTPSSSPRPSHMKPYAPSRIPTSIPPPTPPKPAMRPTVPVSVVRRATSESAPKIPSDPFPPKPDPSTKAHSQTEMRQRSASASTHVRRMVATSPLDEDPEVQARVRAEVVRLRELQEKEIAEAEAEANRIPKVIKRPEVLEDPFEEKQRRYEEEKEKQRRIALRLLREQQWKEQEEREQREREQRKLAERERRLRRAREAQEKRKQVEVEKSSRERRVAEEANLKRAASRANLSRTYEQFTAGRDLKGVVLRGYVSVQPGDSMNWKRRFFELRRDSIDFYKDDKKSKLLESMPISGHVSGVHEWDEGFEELRSIPYSFAVRLKGDEPPWLYYSESQEDKELLSSLIDGLR